MPSYKIIYKTEHEFVPTCPTNESYENIDYAFNAYRKVIDELENNKSICGNFTVDLKRYICLSHNYSYAETVTCYKGETYK